MPSRQKDSFRIHEAICASRPCPSRKNVCLTESFRSRQPVSAGPSRPRSFPPLFPETALFPRPRTTRRRSTGGHRVSLRPVPPLRKALRFPGLSHPCGCASLPDRLPLSRVPFSADHDVLCADISFPQTHGAPQDSRFMLYCCPICSQDYKEAVINLLSG